MTSDAEPTMRASQTRVGKVFDKIASAHENGISLQELSVMEDVFRLFDADGSGAIDPKEIRSQMNSLGFEADNSTIYQLISDMDTDGSMKVEFEEFFHLLVGLGTHKPSWNTRANLGEIFNFFDDIDPAKRDGFIDAGNLRRLADILGDDITEKDIDTMIAAASKNGQDHVTCDEFYELMVGCANEVEHVASSSDPARGEL